MASSNPAARFIAMIFLFVVSLYSNFLLAAETDWAKAGSVFVILPLTCAESEAGRQVADSLQLRLRDEVEKQKLGAYVLSWAEMEIYLGEGGESADGKTIAEKLELSAGRRLYLVRGRLEFLAQSRRKAEIAVSVFPPKGAQLPTKTIEVNDERWKPIIAAEATEFILKNVLGVAEQPVPAATKPVRWGASILINGNLEAGKGFTPKGWDTVDNLCSFWVKEGRGHCLLFDTDVNQDQAWDWWKAIKQGAKPAAAPKPIRTAPPHYDAVGGVEGVKLYSDYVPARPGQTYQVAVRIKGPAKGDAKVFVKAYALLPTAKSDKPVRREVWQTYLHCIIKDEEWRSYQQSFTLPTTLPAAEKKSEKGQIKTYQPKIQWIRIMPYATWEVGKYYFDDFELRPGR